MLNRTLMLLLALATALSACGGGRLDEPPPVASTGTGPTTPIDPYAGTAYIKQRRTHLIDGKTYGVARDVFQLLLDQCNLIRWDVYKLGPVQPDEALMAGTDVETYEMYFDNGKAATYRSGYGLSLPDVWRWHADQNRILEAGGTAPPQAPPDCSMYEKHEILSGDLWRDGIHYDLRYDVKKAFGGTGSRTLLKYPRMTEQEAAALPTRTILGQTCRVIVTPDSSAGNAETCLWDRFPAVDYLNLPWELSFRGVFKGSDGIGILNLIETLELSSNKPVDPARLEVPAGFTVVMQD